MNGGNDDKQREANALLMSNLIIISFSSLLASMALWIAAAAYKLIFG